MKLTKEQRETLLKLKAKKEKQLKEKQTVKK